MTDALLTHFVLPRRERYGLTRISHHLTVEARDRPAITSLHLLAVLNVLSSTPPLVKRRAPRTDAPLTHFASPRGEKSGLEARPAEPGIRARPTGLQVGVHFGLAFTLGCERLLQAEH